MNEKSRFFEALAMAVAGGCTIRDAATAAKCAESTAYRVAQTPLFRQRVLAIRSELTFQAVGKLSAAASQAVDCIAELMSPSQEASTRLNAAKAILLQLPALSELCELRERIDVLEQAKSGRRAAS